MVLEFKVPAKYHHNHNGHHHQQKCRSSHHWPDQQRKSILDLLRVFLCVRDKVRKLSKLIANTFVRLKRLMLCFNESRVESGMNILLNYTKQSRIKNNVSLVSKSLRTPWKACKYWLRVDFLGEIKSIEVFSKGLSKLFGKICRHTTSGWRLKQSSDLKYLNQWKKNLNFICLLTHSQHSKYFKNVFSCRMISF